MSEIEAKQYMCIFGGGAIRGLAYLGALRAMKELGIKRIKYGKHAIPRVERNLAFLAYFGFDAD